VTKIQIRSRWNSDTILFECDAPEGLDSGLHMRHALEKATAARADLRGADLRDAYLRGAYLSGADLRGAYLSGADLRDAYLSGAYLSDAPAIPNIHQTVYAAACIPGALNMESWHCGTSHCRAGWVVTLAGEEGKALEDKIGTPAAAMSIYMASDPERWKIERLPNFFCGNEAALADMKRMAEEEAAVKP
jgi:hypothetical protein